MELVIYDRIRNRKVEFFNEFNLHLRFNSVASGFQLEYFYDPDVVETKEMSCIGHYHICYLYHNGVLLLTGYILSIKFHSKKVKQLVSISGYSLPGFLNDCNIATTQGVDAAIDDIGNLKWKTAIPRPYGYSLQNDGLTLKEIADKLIAPFKLGIVIDPAVYVQMTTDAFDETTAKATESIANYLNDLSAQKNIIMTHNEHGNVVFTRVSTRLVPILDFDTTIEQTIPGVEFELDFNGQGMHSQITVFKEKATDEDNAGENTVNNPFVPFVFRPRTIIQNSGTDTDTLLAANNALAMELRNVRLTVSLDRWEDKNGNIIKPNNTISVINPEIYIFKKTEFFIEEVELKGNQKALTAKLHCVPKACYDGTNPVYLWQGINLH
jgi:prophage tail gpP-like protein